MAAKSTPQAPRAAKLAPGLVAVAALRQAASDQVGLRPAIASYAPSRAVVAVSLAATTAEAPLRLALVVARVAGLRQALLLAGLEGA